MDDGKGGYELEIPYEEAEADTSSTKPEELKKSLHAGRIPEAYKDVTSDMKVEEVRRKVKEEAEGCEKGKPIYGTKEEMLDRAREGYFVRDPERNLVYCPAGEILRQKCMKKNGNIRYANKNACKHCKNRNKCYKGKGEWKEIDFRKDSLEKMSQRMSLSEHPFGTIKRVMGATYFLLKGLRKVEGEFALFCLGYNIERAKNLLGFGKMMELMAGA